MYNNEIANDVSNDEKIIEENSDANSDNIKCQNNIINEISKIMNINSAVNGIGLKDIINETNVL